MSLVGLSIHNKELLLSEVNYTVVVSNGTISASYSRVKTIECIADMHMHMSQIFSEATKDFFNDFGVVPVSISMNIEVGARKEIPDRELLKRKDH